MSYHGYPRATGDIDVWVAIHPTNAKKIIKSLQEFGFVDPTLCLELFLADNKVIRMGVPPLRIEILTTISGVKFEDCYKKRIKAKVEGIPINFISLEDLKKNKKESGRHKDLNDLENLP